MKHSHMTLSQQYKLLDKLPDAPEGYELTGEYRVAQPGEWYFDGGYNAVKASFRTGHNVLILRKIAPEYVNGDVWMDEGGYCRVRKDGSWLYLNGDRDAYGFKPTHPAETRTLGIYADEYFGKSGLGDHFAEHFRALYGDKVKP